MYDLNKSERKSGYFIKNWRKSEKWHRDIITDVYRFTKISGWVSWPLIGQPLNINGFALVKNQFETYVKSKGSGTFCDNISDADIMYAISARTRFQWLALDWCHVKYNCVEKWSQLAKLFQWPWQIYWPQEGFQINFLCKTR